MKFSLNKINLFNIIYYILKIYNLYIVELYILS
jgi:hypothetical protein